MAGANGHFDTQALGPRASADPVAPSRELGTVGLDVPAAVRAARGRLLAAPAHDQKTGRFIGSAAPSLRSGADSSQLAGELGPLRDGLYRQTLADQGHDATDATVTLAEAGRSLSRLSVLEESFWQYIVGDSSERPGHGVITSKGKTTAAVSRLLAVIDRKLKIIGLLGLERRQRQGLTLADILGERARETESASSSSRHDDTSAAPCGDEGDTTP